MPLSVDLGPRLAVGGTAELFAWQDNRVVKLYWEGASIEAAEREAARTRAARAAGAPAPDVFDLVCVEERPGVVFERLDGALMLDVLGQQPNRVDELARQLADLQADLHQRESDDLPPLREHVLRRVHLGALPARVKPIVVEALDDLPDEHVLCHGDLHPGNVILTRDGARVIDWFDATAGSPAADLARTCVLLQYARLNSSAQTSAFAPVRQRFVEVFLEHYHRRSPSVAQDLSKWFTPIAAARTAEPILGHERTTLLRVIDTLLGSA
ncbi:MAG TPA: phosphotransferase [Burkholderiales bacterium]|nr:phosphotransferase [Burkholderiales bacterium]